MAQNELASNAAQNLAMAFSLYLAEIPESTVTVQRPAQDYTIVRLVPTDGSDYEEVIIDTRPPGESYSVTHRTVPRT